MLHCWPFLNRLGELDMGGWAPLLGFDVAAATVRRSIKGVKRLSLPYETVKGRRP